MNPGAAMKILIAVFSVLFCAELARADVIALWQNDALGGNEVTAPANTLGTNIESAVIGRGPGGTATVYTNTFGMRNANAVSLEDAVTSNRYLTISVAAEDGYMFTVTNMFIRLQAQNATSYEVYFTLYSDVTGYGAGDELTTWTVGGTGNSNDWLGQPRSVDLSTYSEFEDLTEVEFRVYVWGQQGGAFTQTGVGRAFQTNGTDDLVLTGTISVVPEPGSLALLGLGIWALARRRRLV